MISFDNRHKRKQTLTPNVLVGENLEEQLLDTFVGILYATTKKKRPVAIQRNKKKGYDVKKKDTLC